MTVAIHVAIAGAVLCWWLVLDTSALAEGAWALWVRTCKAGSQECRGEWQRGETYEAERWCRAARTVAVNRALTTAGRKTVHTRGTVPEYQCFPDTVDPRGREEAR